MFRAKIADAKYWRGLMNAISTLVDEATFNITEDKFSLRAMDSSHIAMVDFEMPSAAFEEFVCDTPVKMTVNVNEMLKLMRNVKSDEVLEMELREDVGKLVLRLRGRYVRNFSLALLDTAGEEPPTPKISFKAHVQMATDALKQAITDAARVAENVRFEATKDQFVVKASGDIGSVEAVFSADSDAIREISVEEDSKATFNLDYLEEMVKAATGISDEAIVEFSTNMPLRLDFPLTTGALRFYLAPRIESE